jgi:hypothetical protein
VLLTENRSCGLIQKNGLSGKLSSFSCGISALAFEAEKEKKRKNKKAAPIRVRFAPKWESRVRGSAKNTLF